MTADVVELREQAWTEGVELSGDEAVAISRSLAGVEVRPTARAGVFDLRASSTVGTLVLPTRPVVIRPKVSVGRLLWMLDVVGHVPIAGPMTVFDEDQDLLSSMQGQYAELLARALALGPVREYVATAEDVHALRGVPDLLHVQTRRFGLLPPVQCRFEEYSVDTEVNRMLLAAALILARWKRTDAARRLEGSAARLAGVREVRYAAERVPEPLIDRRHAHVVPALRMAQLVLRRASFEFRDGRVRAMSFLVDMNRVYEEFVIHCLRQVLGLSAAELVAHPRGLSLDVQHQYQLLPDCLWRSRTGRRLLVLDVKYKQADVAPREDVYQMAAYAAALGLDRGVLVYAGVPRAEHALVHGLRLLTVQLRLDGTAEDIAARVAEIGRDIAGFAGVAVPWFRPDALLRPSTEHRR